MTDMPVIYSALGLFIAFIIYVSFRPFWQQKKQTQPVDANQRDEANITLYREHKAEIERDYEQGKVDQESYQYLIAELDKSLLQDMDANKKVDAKEVLVHNRLTALWPAIIAVFIVVFAAAMYYQTGAYQQLQQKVPAPQMAHEQLDEAQKLIIRIQKLTELTKQAPDNADNWYALGQALIGAGDFATALTAFDQVIRIEGVQADLVGAKAQAAYYLHQQQLTPEVQGLIDQALTLDPKESSTNILLGMHHFTQQKYQEAIHYWQLVIDSNYNNVNVQALTGALNEAKKRAGLLDPTMLKSANAETGSTNSASLESSGIENSVIESSGPQLKVAVSLSDDIYKKLAEGSDKVVFIYAIPTNGQRMPLAAVKLNASDLPISITLSNQNAMTPQANLSSASEVHLIAVISNSGTPGIKSGDYHGKVSNLSVDTSQITSLVINQLAP